MTDEDRLELAKQRIARLNEKLDVAPPACSECRWRFGANPGYYTLGKGENCSNPVVMITGEYCEVTGKKAQVLNIHKARSPQGPCGPNAVFFQAKPTPVTLLKRLRDFLFGETQ